VVAVGRSPAALELRRAMTQAAHATTTVALVGEAWAAADVAAAIHRFAGLPDDLFVVWRGSWAGVNPWPAGSLLVTAAADCASARTSLPPGWRLIVSAASEGELAPLGGGELALVRVPPVGELAADLPFIVRAQLAALSPTLQASAEAVAILAEIARGRGFAAFATAAAAAVGRANGQLDSSHLVEEGGVVLVDAVLAQSNPLMALEERLLRQVLDRSEWRMQEAADRLGISRVTLWRKLKDHGIERPGNGGSCNGHGA
jgi:DNA-binding NtrC family response regulator